MILLSLIFPKDLSVVLKLYYNVRIRFFYCLYCKNEDPTRDVVTGRDVFCGMIQYPTVKLLFSNLYKGSTLKLRFYYIHSVGSDPDTTSFTKSSTFGKWNPCFKFPPHGF